VIRRDGRVDEGARLESECAATYRGFESIRGRLLFLMRLSLSSLESVLV